ncbi:hypothetical protein [Mycolicibacterium fortuitum]|uniref:hypothetical protein n=1 Tax=Mycolicibacterium fortuitum TaxID=1766 RepID=UPI0007EA09EA|nr:hypothetical protein [Mycolicibacterium fortuitum]OBG50176.1 hypothetical protein A5670_26400 [Mycolicibacterium fortuitum]
MTFASERDSVDHSAAPCTIPSPEADSHASTKPGPHCDEPCNLTEADFRAARSAAVIAASIYFASVDTADEDDVMRVAAEFANYVLTGER